MNPNTLRIDCLERGEQGWPASLEDLPNPPERLFFLGDVDLLNAPQVAIVGARACTNYGALLAEQFAYQLGNRGLGTVTGGAYGIDTAAIRGALPSDTRPVVVLPGGLDKPYPAENQKSFERVVTYGGLLVSEDPPGTVPNRRNFLARNRIIMALAQTAVVVEAGLRSGSMAAASWATQLGRPLFAVPGPVTSAASAGCHDLLRSGAARIVVSTEQLVEDAALGTGVPA